MTTTDTRDGDSWPLRSPCLNCGGSAGILRYKSGQHTLYCECGKYSGVCVPKRDLDLPQRHIGHGIPPSTRYQVIKRAGGLCELCGASAETTILHAAHFISDKDGGSIHEDNLFCACEECNLGMGSESVPGFLIERILATRRERERDHAIIQQQSTSEETSPGRIGLLRRWMVDYPCEPRAEDSFRTLG